MNTSNSETVERTLHRAAVHDDWIASYRTRDNVKFFEQAIDHVTRSLEIPKDAKILDAGCGTCVKSILLAERGYQPTAVDFSDVVLNMAESEIASSGMQEKITLQRENILSMTFEDESFDHILCWGVLMHIPDLETAIAELSRVLKKGGTIVLSENNMFSLQSALHRAVHRLLGTRLKKTERTPAGLESWFETDEGRLIVRHTDMRWLKQAWRNHGFTVKEHTAGQFTELYTKIPTSILKKAVHAFNHIWFKFIKIPYPALGNIIIVEKNK